MFFKTVFRYRTPEFFKRVRYEEQSVLIMNLSGSFFDAQLGVDALCEIQTNNISFSWAYFFSDDNVFGIKRVHVLGKSESIVIGDCNDIEEIVCDNIWIVLFWKSSVVW